MPTLDQINASKIGIHRVVSTQGVKGIVAKRNDGDGKKDKNDGAR
jgi:hypothetical protein